MAEPKRRKINIDELEKFKWEFLRRNKRYQFAYDNYIKRGARKKEGEELASDWWLEKSLDYKKTYEEIMEVGKKRLFVPYHFSLNLDVAYEANCPLIYGDFMVDISYPKELIVEAFKKYLNSLMQSYKESKGPYKKSVTGRRTRPKDYKHYLDVYDLREKGWKWSQIAKKLCGNNPPYYATKTLMRQYNSCKRFIEKYRQIA